MMTSLVEDGHGIPVLVGSTVTCDPDDPWSTAEVEWITDPDGDVDDEGRSVYWPPRVRVIFADGSEGTFCTYTDPVDPGRHICDDLEVVP